ncbi:acyltransferase family protein [Bacteroides xylanisolvens]|uniref:acyltransferase family protein n=1 Tax=Bacteroides xylanisolvens TaxID=371601 RepID=UPI0039B6532A
MTSTNYARYNWIDWSKSIAIFLVIWGHVPMAQSEAYTFINSFHMPLFFLISGYLYNPKETIKEELYKEFKTLMLPYLIYQLIYYPYWFVREILVSHQVFSIQNSIIHPIIQSLLSDGINGPTWFIYCLFLIKMYSFVMQRKQSLYWLTASTSCLMSILICYWLNNQSIYGTRVIHSFFALQIFFFAGQALKRTNIKNIVNSLRQSILWFLISTILFIMFILIGYTSIYTTWAETLNFYALGFTGSSMIFGIGFILNRIKSNINYHISTGTLVILGIHWMFIGVFNFIMEKHLHIIDDITYSSFIAFIISLFIITMNYPLIIFCEKHFPLLLGKIRTTK